MFDGEEGTPTWDVLRLRLDFASAVGVMAALQGRVEQVAGLDHPSFRSVRIAEEPGEPGRVLLLSAYASGRRLSELRRSRSAAFAMTLIRDLTHALAALQKQGENVTHGSLTTDRILVTPDGRLIIRDHVLGAVLDQLALPARLLWSELGVLRPTDRRVSGRQLDVIDVALVALTCLLGRSIGPDEYPRRADELVQQHVLFPPLRHWLEAALGLNGDGLSSAEDALEAIRRYFPGQPPGHDEIRAALAVFGGKCADPRPLPHGPPGLARFLREEGGTAFQPARARDNLGSGGDPPDMIGVRGARQRRDARRPLE